MVDSKETPILFNDFELTHFSVIYSIDCSRGDEKIVLIAEQKSSGEDIDVLTQEISTSILYEEEEDKEKDTSLPNIFTEIGDISEGEGYTKQSTIYKIASTFCFRCRNLMMDTTEDILKTFFDHEDQLKQLYDEQIIQFVSCVFCVLCVTFNVTFRNTPWILRLLLLCISLLYEIVIWI